MIVFINGPFGVGKTTVAEQLVARLPQGMIFDAELVGYLLRRVLGTLDQPDDFQDLAIWRTLTVTTATPLRATYGQTLVTPMTIWRPDYFAEIVGACGPPSRRYTTSRCSRRRRPWRPVSATAARRSRGGWPTRNAASPHSPTPHSPPGSPPTARRRRRSWRRSTASSPQRAWARDRPRTGFSHQPPPQESCIGPHGR